MTSKVQPRWQCRELLGCNRQSPGACRYCVFRDRWKEDADTSRADYFRNYNTSEKRKAYVELWRQSNKEKIKQYNKEWRQRHLEHRRQYMREYRAKQKGGNDGSESS